ncbi:MAG: hypothetical protein U0003_05575 [Vampirovibrionales bacterium]
MGDRFFPQCWRPAAALMLLAYGVVLFSGVDAAELNGFRLESSDNGALAIHVQADAMPTYDVEPLAGANGSQGVSIILKDTQLSNTLRQKGLPVVIDNRNRTIGRAVPGEGNTVKIVIPNWKGDAQQLQIKSDTGRAAFTPPKTSTPQSLRSAPAELLKSQGAFQSQFQAAAKAAQQSYSTTDDPPLSLPAVEVTSSSTAPIRIRPSTRAKKPRYRSVTLPKVVSLTNPAPTDASQAVPVIAPLAATNAAPPSRSALPTPTAWPASSTSTASITPLAPPTPQSTGWDTSSYGGESVTNPYGVSSVADTVTPSSTSASPTTGWGASVKRFFDDISGNRFSAPYGMAFWALMVGVTFVGCLGFLALSVGALCTRLIFTPLGAKGHLVEEGAPVLAESRGEGRRASSFLDKYLGAGAEPEGWVPEEAVAPPGRLYLVVSLCGQWLVVDDANLPARLPL